MVQSKKNNGSKMDRPWSISSRRVQSYSVVGTWPSAVARVMSATRIWAVAGGPAASNTHNG